MKPRVTQRDVARKARVSHVTVSLALRDHASIPASTAQRIKGIALQLGYCPDPMLAALSAYRKVQRPTAYHANLGWINNYEHPADLYAVGDFDRYHRGARQRAKELGYVLEEICLCDFSHDLRRAARSLNARGIRGLIFAPTTPAGAVPLDISTYSAVRLGYSVRSPVVNTITAAQFRTMLLTMQQLIARGYRRPGVVFATGTVERTSYTFLGGFLAGYAGLPAATPVPPFYCDRPHVQIKDFVKWLRRHRVDCVIGTGSHPHHDLLRETGMRAPDDIGYVDIALAEDETFLSGMHQNANKIGRSAVDLLVSMMQRNEVGACELPSHWLIEPSWLEGKTLRPIAAPDDSPINASARGVHRAIH